MKLKKIIASVAAVSVLASVAVSATTASAALTWTPPTDGYVACMFITSNEFSSWTSMFPNGAKTDKKPTYEGQYEGGFGQDALVKGDGTYTVAVEAPADGDTVGGDQYITGKIFKDPDGYYRPTNMNCPDLGPEDAFLADIFAPTVFTVDIIGLVDGTEVFDADTLTHKAMDKPLTGTDSFNCNPGPYKASAIKATVDSIKFDGVEAKFDPSKVYAGNIEDNNYNYRIEISNTYGISAKKGCCLIDPPADEIDARKIEVTFTLSGLGGGTPATSGTTGTTGTTGGNNNNAAQPSTQAAADNNTTTTAPSTSTGANTGATAGLALGGIALAGVAIVLAKKRK